jgi:hypothetical protein
MQRCFLAHSIAALVSVAVPSYAGEPERFSAELQPPIKVQAGDRALDVGRSGHAAPYFADVDGDGRRDLLVGQYADGRVRLYRNQGTNKAPRFGSFEYVLAGGQPASVPVYCCIGFTPQLIDLDGDGRLDLLSGSAPGEIYWFRGDADKTFAAGEKLVNADGKEITPGSIATAFAVDWDSDGRLDLVLGNVMGEVHLARNVSSGGKLCFEQPQKIDLADPREDKRDSGPVAADWDGDGRFDLVVGMEDGSVCWFHNTGELGRPSFSAGKCLVPASPLAARTDDARGPHDCGQRTKVCVADYNDDGRPDLLVGDMGGWTHSKPEQTPAEVIEEQEAHAALPKLRAEWVAAYAAFRKLGTKPASSDPVDNDAQSKTDDRLKAQRDKLLARVTELKTKIDAAESIVKRYEVQQQTHGYVWAFLRKSADGKDGQPLAAGSVE